MKLSRQFVIFVSIAGLFGSIIRADFETDATAGITFVDIPGETFEMGDHFGTGKGHERPVHTVSVSAFRISKYEVTNAQYAEYLNSAMAEGLIKVTNGVVYASTDETSQPYFHTSNVKSISQISFEDDKFTVQSRSGLSMDDHPVVAITWYGAKAFCDFYGYRLPTEAEWEYAARGGFHSPYFKYPWGSNSTNPSQLNYSNVNPLGLSFPKTTPVGYYPAYGYGLCNMAGNISEWCNDWWDANYYENSPEIDPQGPPSGTARSVRGGNWAFSALDCRVAGRGSRAPGWSCPYGAVGFRPAMDVLPPLDFNGDGVVDLDDLVILIEYWGMDEPLCDIAPEPSGDGVVDIEDLTVFIEYWEKENMPQETEEDE